MPALFWGPFVFLAALFLFEKLVERLPLALARLAFIRVGDEVRLPVSTATALLLPAGQDVSTHYREAPSRRLSLASFTRSVRVERGREVLRFVPGRNWIVARQRGQTGNVSLALVRVDVSSAEGAIVMRARYLPLDLAWSIVFLWWLFHLFGFAGSVPMMAAVLVVGVTGVFIGPRRAARSCFDAAVVEMRRLIEEAEASASSAMPLPSEAPAAERR